MRHRASLLASLEGMSRPAFRIAKELTSNSRSGLTVRFLSKKLELPEEEIEYLLDVNNRLMFTDLTKVKIASEGHAAIRRVQDGLENHGDIASLMRLVKGLDPHDFRQLEDQLGLDQALTKKTAAEALIERVYHQPDGVLTYVATREFSDTARELFDILWQSKDGIMPVSQLRAAHGGPEGEIEHALWELFASFAAFEMFRFDSEERLVRVAALLSEIRRHREESDALFSGQARLQAMKDAPASIQVHGLNLSDTLCRLVAAVAARPVRLRGDGELFREDRRRLADICAEEDEPSLNTCLWVAEGVGWLRRADNTLRAGELEGLIGLDRVSRHRIVFEWLMSQGEEAGTRALFNALLDEMKSGAWYNLDAFLAFAVRFSAEQEQAVLRQSGGGWEYVSPSVTGQSEHRLGRSLQEALFWLGIVERGLGADGDAFRVTELGEALFCNAITPKLQQLYPPRKGEFVVQPNFDIVVPVQDMDPLLTVPLDQFAVRMSSGQATVYNVTKDSFTQAVQEGHDANAFVNFLLEHNRGGSLPSNVMMTLEDWRGAMKRVRLRTIHVLEADDPLVLADLLHRRRLNKHFTPVDARKVVAINGVSKAALAKALEKDGFIVE
jgi:hypothetical protein